MNTSSLHGAGLGLRAEYVDVLCSDQTKTPPAWLELLADNHFHPAGMKLAQKLSERYPVTLHCVGMNLGSAKGVDKAYLEKVAALARQVNPVHISDHITFTAVGNRHHHDLWPLPQTAGVATIVAQNIDQVQQHLGQQILIENISSYLQHDENEMDEGRFLGEIISRSDCGLLVDLNNLWVNQHNNNNQALHTLTSLPLERIGYVHIAGCTTQGELLIDTHSQPPCDAVWSLLETLQSHMPGTPVLLEWDDELPPYHEMATYLQRAQHSTERVIRKGA